MALYTYSTSKFHPDKIRIDRHKFIPCQELTLFRTEVKKKNAPVTISHTRISDIGELPPGQKPPHSFGTFEAQQDMQTNQLMM